MALEHWLHDLRLACRRLGGAKGFTAAAVLTLALGMAGTTAMFALVQTVLLRPLPVHEPQRLIVAWKELRASGFAHAPFGDVEIEAVARESKLLQSTAGLTRHGTSRWVAVEDGDSQYVRGALVTGGFFEVLGVEAVLGRTLELRDDIEGADAAVVISYGLWRRRYGGAPDVIGRRLTISERAFTIVGVMPAGLDVPAGVEVWRTTKSVRLGEPGALGAREVDLVARLGPGVTIAQAAAELGTLTKQLEADAAPGAPRGLLPVVRTLQDAVAGDVRPALLALFGAVWLVLLIAGANVANLLLVRGDSRRPEFAVRAALGAGRGRLVRELFVESLVVSLAASAAGVAMAWWGLRALVAIVPGGLPRVDSVPIDIVVVLFSGAVAIVTAAVAGVAPALALARADLMADLRACGRGVAGSSARYGRQILVVVQVALAVAIVAAAGLLTRSLLRLQAVDMGLSAGRLVFVELAVPARLAGSPRHARFLDEVVSRLQDVPGVAAATPVNVPPFTGISGWDVPVFTAEGQGVHEAAMNPALNLESIHPGYFDTIGVTFVRGRPFDAADREGTVRVAILSADVAARTWPGQDPIGRRLKMGGPDSEDGWLTVVGTVAPTRYRELAEARPTLYLPARQFLNTAQMLVLRTALPVEQVASAVRNGVAAVDPAVRVMRIAPFDVMLDRPLERPRFNALLSGIFAVAALLLAAVGVFAVVAALVRQREAEIGIRAALGATAGDLRRLVLGEGLRLAVLGAAAGLCVAAAGTRVMRGLLFEIDPLDPGTLLAATLVLVVAAALASYLPARRAAQVDPVDLLRSN